LGTLCWGTARCQEHNDQITVVIPALQKGSSDIRDTDAPLMSYLFAQSILCYFDRGSGNVHRSAVVQIPSPLDDDKPATLATLARINGAQMAVSMKAIRQSGGALIYTTLEIPPRYRDFRLTPVEVIHLTFDGASISLDVPTRYTVFPALFLSADMLRTTYRDGGFDKLCPIDKRRCDDSKQPIIITGPCKTLGNEIPYSETMRYLELNTTSVAIYNRQCYSQKWPAEGPIDMPVVNFIVGVQRFFAGDWTAAREKMLSIAATSSGTKESIIIQAYLYLVRISLQTKNIPDAQQYMDQAVKLNSRDPNVIETRRFLHLWTLINTINDKNANAKLNFATVGRELSKEPSFVQARYQALLGKIRTHLKRAR
jgi:hypothetical protein